MARPTTPIISRERAAKMALNIIDAVGLEGLSVKILAGRLGVRPSSLYHHFETKRDLLAEVARLLIVDSPLAPIGRPVDWREAFIDVSLTTWRRILRHPKAAPLLLEFFPRNLVSGYESWARLLEITGIPAEDHLWIIEGAEKLTYGSALYASASRTSGTPPFPEYCVEQNPTLARAVRANPLDEQAVFVRALRSYLDGIPDPPR